eukprot:85283-Chlamydomonas_euryale.AAC.2
MQAFKTERLTGRMHLPMTGMDRCGGPSAQWHSPTSARPRSHRRQPAAQERATSAHLHMATVARGGGIKLMEVWLAPRLHLVRQSKLFIMAFTNANRRSRKLPESPWCGAPHLTATGLGHNPQDSNVHAHPPNLLSPHIPAGQLSHTL